tara:strand:+ start:1122 stop:1277 length:156 start_codon:yes stop_codon:yes gene_type:complete
MDFLTLESLGVIGLKKPEAMSNLLASYDIARILNGQSESLSQFHKRALGTQ